MEGERNELQGPCPILCFYGMSEAPLTTLRPQRPTHLVGVYRHSPNDVGRMAAVCCVLQLHIKSREINQLSAQPPRGTVWHERGQEGMN